MLPLIPFAAGLLAGAAAIRLLRSDRARTGLSKARTGLDKARAGLDQAQEKLRGAAISGLTAIEATSARARERLATQDEAPAAPPASTESREAAPPLGDEEKAS